MASDGQVAEQCSICRESAMVSVHFDSERNAVECDRCGHYRITGTAKTVMKREEYDSDQRVRLSAAARRAWDNRRRLDIDTYSIPDLIASVTSPRDPMEAGDEVLLYISGKVSSFGQPVPFHIATDYPLFVLPNAGSLSNVLQYMESMNWARVTAGPTGNVILQPPGYARVRELKATTRASKRAFVAMSFHPDFRSAYDKGICPAIEQTGFKSIRVDDEQHNDRIDEKIIVELKRSAFVVADVSDPRTAVFFEAGYGLGLGLPVIWACSAATFGDLPKNFDTRQFNHIKWDTPEDLLLQLKTRILATVPGAVQSAED